MEKVPLKNVWGMSRIGRQRGEKRFGRARLSNTTAGGGGVIWMVGLAVMNKQECRCHRQGQCSLKPQPQIVTKPSPGLNNGLVEKWQGGPKKKRQTTDVGDSGVWKPNPGAIYCSGKAINRSTRRKEHPRKEGNISFIRDWSRFVRPKELHQIDKI